jgi:parvulin-like peptidyl-prolyl isomerase
MAKKKKLESKAPVPLTRGQLSRAQREQQRIRNLYTLGIALGAFVLLVLAFAVISTFIIKPNSEVASVNGTKINRATYSKLRKWNLFQQVQQQAIQDQLTTQTGGTISDSSILTGLVQQLKDVDNESTLDQSTIQALVDDEVLRQASIKDFQLNPTTDQLKDEAKKDFLPSPTPPPSSETPTPEISGTPTSTVPPTSTPISSTITPSPTQTRTPTITPTRGTPTVTPTATATYPPVPGASATAESIYNRYVKAITGGPNPSTSEQICAYGCPGLNESDYLNIVIEPRWRQNTVTDHFASTIITDVEQIHVQHILTDTQEGAVKIRQMLDAGADFTTLANEQSSEQIQNVQNGSPANGGDLGWFPQDTDINNLVPEFVAGAWPVKAGEYSQPVQTSFGWHIIKVIERNPHMPLTQAQIDTKKNKLYSDWLAAAKTAAVITPSFAQQPTPTAPPLLEPTLPPVATATPGGSEPITGTTTTTNTVTTDVGGGSTPTAPPGTPAGAVTEAAPTATKSP